MKRSTLITLLILAVIGAFVIPNICNAAENTRFAQFYTSTSLPSTAPSFTKISGNDSNNIPDAYIKFKPVETPIFAPTPPPAEQVRSIADQAIKTFDLINKAIDQIDKALDPIVKRDLTPIHGPYGEPIQPINPKVFEPEIKTLQDIGKKFIEEAVSFVGPFIKAADDYVKDHPIDETHLMTINSIDPTSKATLPTEPSKVEMVRWELKFDITEKDQALATGAIPTDMYLTPQELRELDAKGLQQTGKSNFYTKDLQPITEITEYVPLPQVIGRPSKTTDLNQMVGDLIKTLNPDKNSDVPVNKLHTDAESIRNEQKEESPINNEPEGKLTLIFTTRYQALQYGLVPTDMYLTPQELRMLNACGAQQTGKSGFYTQDLPPKVIQFGSNGPTFIVDDPAPHAEIDVIRTGIELISEPKPPLPLKYGTIDKADADGTVHYTKYDRTTGEHNHYYGPPDSISKDVETWLTKKETEPTTETQEDYNGNGVFQNGDGADYSGFNGYGQEGFGEPRNEGSSYDPYENYVGPND